MLNLNLNLSIICFSLLDDIPKCLQPGGQSFSSCMLIKGENKKGDGGPSPNFQPSLDEFLKESIDTAFKRSEEDHPIHSTG